MEILNISKNLVMKWYVLGETGECTLPPTEPPTPNWSPYIFTLVQKAKSDHEKFHASINKPRLCQDSASYFIQK